MRRLLSLFVLLLLLVACGGNTVEEPVAESNGTGTENTAETTDTDSTEEESIEEPESEPVAEEEAMEEETAAEDEAMEEETAAEDETDEEDAAAEEESGDAAMDVPMSGIDPDTGLEINPDPIPKGVEFIAVGQVIQMNLTPQSSPEFVIRGPNNVTYRIATQALSDIYTLDGGQLQPFEYKINMIAKATAFLAPDASLSDVLTSDDFTIVSLP